MARAVLDARLISEHTLVQPVQVKRGDMTSPQQKLISCLGYGLRIFRKLGHSTACQHLYLALALVIGTAGQSLRLHKTIALSEAILEARIQITSVHCQTEDKILTRPIFEHIMASLEKTYKIAI